MKRSDTLNVCTDPQGRLRPAGVGKRQETPGYSIFESGSYVTMRSNAQ